MKSALILTCAALALAGCARFNDRSYGSWLDSVGMPQANAPRLTPEEAKAYRAEVAQLNAQAEAVRVKLAAEPSRVQRIEYIKELRDIGDRQRPLEQALRLGPTPAAQPTPQPGNAGA